MEFLIALIYLSSNIKISNYHPCLEADVNEKERCPNYKGPHFYIEKKKTRNIYPYKNVDEFVNDDTPWESLNMLTIPWNPFLKNVERQIGSKYPDVWVSVRRIPDHPSEGIPIYHPFMPKDYYKIEKITRKEKPKEEGIKHLPMLASIFFAVLAKFCSVWTLYWRERYKIKEDIDSLTIQV